MKRKRVMKKHLTLIGYVLIFISAQLLPILSDGFAAGIEGPSEFFNSEWQFGRGDGSVIAHKIRLLPGGKIDGYYHPNEDHWGVEEGYLIFYHKNGNPTCRFTSSQSQNGRRILSGQFLLNQNVIHVLKEIR